MLENLLYLFPLSPIIFFFLKDGVQKQKKNLQTWWCYRLQGLLCLPDKITLNLTHSVVKWHSWRLTNTTFFFVFCHSWDCLPTLCCFVTLKANGPVLCFHSPSLYGLFSFLLSLPLCVFIGPEWKASCAAFLNPTFLKLQNIKYVLDGTQKWDLLCKHFEGRNDILEVVWLHFWGKCQEMYPSKSVYSWMQRDQFYLLISVKLRSHRPRQRDFKSPLPKESQCKRAFRDSAFKMCCYIGFYNRFRAETPFNT